jgi:hypothetical protein|tara:strand:+ start:77 stop:226 length:150 start_codon:yes stop_codon:yes gene_type:complete
MNLVEIKKRLEEAYNTEDWNIVEDLIDVLDTYITIGEDGIDWEEDEDIE